MVRDNPNCPPPPAPGRVESLLKELRESERTIALLLAAGLVSEEKVKQARELVSGLS